MIVIWEEQWDEIDDDAWGWWWWWRLINGHLPLQLSYGGLLFVGVGGRICAHLGGLIFDLADMGMCKKMLSLSLCVKIGDSSFFHYADLSFSLHWTHSPLYVLYWMLLLLLYNIWSSLSLCVKSCRERNRGIHSIWGRGRKWEQWEGDSLLAVSDVEDMCLTSNSTSRSNALQKQTQIFFFSFSLWNGWVSEEIRALPLPFLFLFLFSTFSKGGKRNMQLFAHFCSY